VPTIFAGLIALTKQLHHLASVGHLLASVIQQPQSQWSLLQVRNVILAMSGLILGLETALAMKPEISAKLKAHASIIDDKMSSAAAAAVQAQMPSISNTHSASSIANFPSPAPPPAHPAANFGLERDGPDNWTFDFSPDHQMQLHDVLTSNWPLDFASHGSLGLDSFDAAVPSAQMPHVNFWEAPIKAWGEWAPDEGRGR
jgi:hypothetical protein